LSRNDTTDPAASNTAPGDRCSPSGAPADCTEWARTEALEDDENRIEIVIPGRVDAVGPAVDRIMSRVRETECIEGHEFEVEVALLEALANAVEHGCGGDEAKQVTVLAACCPECGLLVVIRDPGSGFEPENLPNPVEGENLYRTHGRGVWLINRLMDEVHYDKRGTELRMHKRSKKAKGRK
jgi:serine/threonine-protein kinase RsbW